MIDNDNIILALSNFSFVSYSRAIEKLLLAYHIVETTIAKIVGKINKGENGPFYVYRRAVIYCVDTDDYAQLVAKTKESMPLTIVFQPKQIIIINQQYGEIACPYEEIVKHLDYLSPLQNWDVNRNDHYSTIELDQLVESLYRSLILDDNPENSAREFIFSILYIAHFRSLLDIDEINSVKRGYAESDEQVLKRIYSYLREKDYPFAQYNYRQLKISKESYKYVFAIIKFDTTLVDAEVLTSLIYKMAAREDAGLYGHQTSFVNVEKLLQPMFLEEMQQKANDSITENVFQVVTEIYNTVIFDPTNGPGCYLVASYNGLLQQLRDIERQFDIKCHKPLNISNFIALVENDLTKELTILALVFTHTQELKRMGLLTLDTIREICGMLCVYVGDEVTSDWNNFVTPSPSLYIVGSPQFKGTNKLEGNKKIGMQRVFGAKELYNADYCSTWLVKAAQLIKGSEAKAAFVMTNSVSQGSQSTYILDKVNESGCEYIFGYRPFKWKVSNSDNSAVTVVAIGIASKGVVQKKYIFSDSNKIPCQIIGANLIPDIDLRIEGRSNPLSKQLPHMRKGNMPDGATALTFTSPELDEFLKENPDAAPFVKPLFGGDEFVKSTPRYCLWISDEQLPEALKVKGIAERIEIVRATRCKPKSTASIKSRNNPHKFRETNVTSKGKVSLIIPCVTSERRHYLQMGILDSTSIVNNNVLVIFDADIWLLALLESRMHLVWVTNSAGKHEERPRYSADLCYNTFPVPELDKKQIGTLRNLSRTLLEVREHYCDKSLGQLYNNMPPELVRVHQWIDNTVDSFYRSQPFETDVERLIWMKNLYNNMLENE